MIFGVLVRMHDLCLEEVFLFYTYRFGLRESHT